MVTKGSALTIWCQGSPQPAVYALYKERGAEPWLTSTPQDPRNKTSFLIELTRSQHAGIYQCAYYSAGTMWSERSDPLTLVVTGKGEPGPLPTRLPQAQGREGGLRGTSPHRAQLGHVG